MSKLIFGSLSLLFTVIAFVPSVKAGEKIKVTPTHTEKMQQYEETSSVNTKQNADDERETQAFNLVNSAYRGEYEEQGISSYSQFIDDYNTGDVTPAMLIKAGIEQGDLAPEALDDEGYINAIELQMETLRSR